MYNSKEIKKKLNLFFFGGPSMQFSKLLFRLLTLALFLAPLGAMAQIGGLYAAFSTTALSTSGSPEFNGATIGGYDEVNLKHSLPVLNIGGDARMSFTHANDGTGFSATSDWLDSYLIGPEVSFKTPVSLRPYAEILFGGAYVSASASGYGMTISASKNYGELDYVGGVDWKLAPHLAWRIAEINYGMFNSISATTFSTGVVLRLP